MPGFPNFFMLYGPGTNGGEIVTMLESQAEYAVRAMKRMIRERVTAIEVQAALRGAVEPLAPVADGGHVVDDEQQLLHVTHRQGRHPVALRQHRYRVMTKVLGRVSETTRRRDPTSVP